MDIKYRILVKNVNYFKKSLKFIIFGSKIVIFADFKTAKNLNFLMFFDVFFINFQTAGGICARTTAPYPSKNYHVVPKKFSPLKVFSATQVVVAEELCE